MIIDFYSGIFKFLDDKNIKYTLEQNIVRLENYNYALFLVLKSNTNSIDDFKKKRELENTNFNKLLVFIWYDLWQNKEKIILSKLTHLCGFSKKIHARKTLIQNVNREDCEIFFLENHLNQPLIGYKRIGLYLNNEMIALASFAKRRKFRDNTYSSELLQFATQDGIHINGGLSKLIKHFRISHSFDTLMTYIDLDWSNGEKFSKIGFKIDSIKAPVYFKKTESTNLRKISSQKTDIFNLGNIKSIQYLKVD
jgi:hypothetical protein